MTRPFDRRRFLQAAAAATTVSAFSRPVWADSPGGKLRTAHIGVGGMGRSDLHSIRSHPQVEVSALCDVDENFLNSAHAEHGSAETFRDYRELFDRFADKIDAVVVSTPDHTHAPAAMRALEAGKPVYCQKPLTHEAYEARQLRLAAEKSGLPTQMGIQIHSHEAYRQAVAMVQGGAIGKVSRVYAWSSKGWGYNGGPFENTQEPPKTLKWNLWLGVAKERPYVPEVYHPAQWRRLIDFGTGSLGDMGVHIFDTPYGALELTAPNWVQTFCRPPTGVGHPMKNRVEYEFPGTQYTTETVRWTWTDGAWSPPKVEDDRLPADLQLPGQGSLMIGSDGVLLLPHVDSAQLFPAEQYRDYQRPTPGGNNHYHQWVDACLAGDASRTTASFSYGGPLTEALLLGVVGNRFPEERLEWDAEALEITNHAEANQLLRRKYRDGFEVAGL